MKPTTPLSVADIRVVADALRSDIPLFRSDRYIEDIDPWWLATPERRGMLWDLMARFVELDG